MARPRKPTKLKLLQGTYQPCREMPEAPFPLAESMPEAPDWLSAVGKREFDRLAGQLLACGVLTEAAVMPLAHLAALHAKLVQRWAAGCDVNGAMVGAYRAMCNDFGLLPASMSKVAPVGKAGANAFDGNGRRPD